MPLDIDRDDQRLIRRIYRRVIPKPIRQKVRKVAKAAVGAAGSIGLLINATVPDYGDEYKAAVGFVVAVLTVLGIYQADDGRRAK